MEEGKEEEYEFRATKAHTHMIYVIPMHSESFCKKEGKKRREKEGLPIGPALISFPFSFSWTNVPEVNTRAMNNTKS
jgi:hypothetical protein